MLKKVGMFILCLIVIAPISIVAAFITILFSPLREAKFITTGPGPATGPAFDLFTVLLILYASALVVYCGYKIFFANKPTSTQ